MALDTSKSLFLHELVAMRDAESDGGLLLGSLIAARVQNPALEQLLRTCGEESTQQLRNINACLDEFEVSPLPARSEPVAGVRTEFEEFLRMQPSSMVQDMFAINTARRFLQVTIVNYSSLIGTAIFMNEGRCARTMLTNLLQKEASAGQLERIRNEMGERLGSE